MKSFPHRVSRFVSLAGRPLAVLALLVCLAVGARAQSLPKTSDIIEDVSPNGSVNMEFQMTFDAAPWRAWKAMVGDEPARLRAMLRHQFAAYTLEDFKLDRDDMNRVAKMSMHSPVGPELRDDGSFQVPVEGYFRLINNAGRTWYFSGNNPNAGYTLNNVKVTLPANALNAYLANPNNADQALVFALTPPPSSARWFYLAGGVALAVGLALFLAGALTRQRVEILPSVPPRALPATGRVIDVPPAMPQPASPVSVSAPPLIPPQPPPMSPPSRADAAPPRPDAGRNIYSEPD